MLTADSKKFIVFFNLIEMNIFTSYFPSSIETNYKNKIFLSAPSWIVKLSLNISRPLGAQTQQKRRFCETQRD